MNVMIWHCTNNFFFLFCPVDRASDVSEVSQREISNYKTTFDKWPGIVLGDDGEMNKISAEIWFSGGRQSKQIIAM